MIELHIAARAAATELAHLALTDPLTGVPNRRFLDRELAALVADVARDGSVVSAALLDVDRFKAVNDERGHEAGDAVLVAVGHALRRACRRGDFIGRLGGDEFLLVCPHTDRAGIGALAERVRKELKSLTEPISVSIGTATASGLDAVDIVAWADAALYESKAAGRGQVRAAGPQRRSDQPVRRPLGACRSDLDGHAAR